ncbi:MAG: class I SAM-dependent methyltransferase [bacterium]
MKNQHITELVDPYSKKKLSLTILNQDGGHVLEGVLMGEDKREYNIQGGVPRFISSHESDETTHNTIQAFGNKWVRYKAQPKTEWLPFVEFLKEQYLCMLDCLDDQELIKRFQEAKTSLNAGCGIAWSDYGFNVNKDTLRFAVDFSEAVDVAYQRTHDIDNIAVLQGDIFHLPFTEEYFDIVFSNGVVHHTPNPKLAIEKLCYHLKKGGFIGLYIYNVKPFLRELADQSIRTHTTDMSSDECMEFSRQMALLGKSFEQINTEINIAEDIPLLGIKKGNYPLQSFIYDHLVKCFYNPHISFERCCWNNLDWYHPTIASHHTKEEIETWLKDAGVSKPSFRQPKGWEHSGYFVSGYKDS